MKPVSFLSVILAFSLLGSLAAVSARDVDAARMALERRYTTPHSLGNNYVFDPRDGWETVNMTNLLYKYSDSDDADEGDEDSGDNHGVYSHGSGGMPASSGARSTLTRRAKKKSTNPPKPKAAAGVLTNTLAKILDTIKGIGKPEPVTITWYTGHDLENPSCWSNSKWAPTDKSFAAALTLNGWASKPKCFKFLELCHNPSKCVFVRVVDSCAGCASNSKHVDLTKAAFSSLADLDQGLLSVQMRQATDPEDGWLEDLWGPKA